MCIQIFSAEKIRRIINEGLDFPPHFYSSPPAQEMKHFTSLQPAQLPLLCLQLFHEVLPLPLLLLLSSTAAAFLSWCWMVLCYWETRDSNLKDHFQVAAAPPATGSCP